MPWPQQPSMRASTQGERVMDRIRAMMAGSGKQAPAPLDAEPSLQPQSLWEKIKELGGSLAQQPVARVAGMVGDITDEGFRGQTREEPGWGYAGVTFGPNQIVYHGTGGSPFNKFNSAYNQPRDLFGKLTHFTEAPKYAGEVFAGTRQNARVIPAKLNVKNAIDVHNWPPRQDQIDDLLKVGAIDAEMHQDYLRQMPVWEQQSQEFRGQNPQIAAGQNSKAFLRNPLERHLKSDPLALSRSGFDGIKYGDNVGATFNAGDSAPVWAVENPSQAKSPFTGESIGVNIKPSTLHRVHAARYTPNVDELTMMRALDKPNPIGRVRELRRTDPNAPEPDYFDVMPDDWYWDNIPKGGAPTGGTIMTEGPNPIVPQNLVDKWIAKFKDATGTIPTAAPEKWSEFFQNLYKSYMVGKP